MFRFATVIALTFAAARPQSGEVREVVFSEGIDIVVALDISGSMRALDFQPQNRLEVAKNVIASFVDGRRHDRIGLVLFGSEAFTVCPLTLDHDLLESVSRTGTDRDGRGANGDREGDLQCTQSVTGQ